MASKAHKKHNGRRRVAKATLADASIALLGEGPAARITLNERGDAVAFASSGIPVTLLAKSGENEWLAGSVTITQNVGGATAQTLRLDFVQ